MKPIYIPLLVYLALIIFWAVWSKLAYMRAVKDMNERVYQEAEKERENAPDEIKVMAIDSDVGLVDLSDEANHIWKDSEIDTDYLNYLDNLDLESMKYKKKKS